MAPRRVLQTPPPLPSATMAITKLGHTTGTSGNPLNTFGAFRLMEVGSSARTIRVPTALPMSEKPYRKAMVADIFFRKIKALALESDFSSADLVATIATYFDFNTGSAEIESAAAAIRFTMPFFTLRTLSASDSAISTESISNVVQTSLVPLTLCILLFAQRCGLRLWIVEARTASFLSILF